MQMLNSLFLKKHFIGHANAEWPFQTEISEQLEIGNLHLTIL